MSSDQSDVQDFSWHLLASNRRLLPDVEVWLKCKRLPNTPVLQGVRWVGLSVHFYDETVGNIDHYLGEDYDPEYMRCRVLARIALYRHSATTISEQVYTPYRLRSETTAEDVAVCVGRVTESFILPELIKLGVSISKDDWTQQ